MQKNAADLGRRLGHENLRARETSHGHRQRADVVLMGVGHQDRFDLTVTDCFKIRQRIFSGVVRVHPAIEEEPVLADLEIVRVRSNLRMPCEINEFQVRLPRCPEGFLSELLLSEQSLSRLV